MKTIGDGPLEAPPVNEQHLIGAGVAPSRVGPHSGRTLGRAEDDLNRLVAEPTFREEFHRLRELLGPAEPKPPGGATAVLGLVPRGPRPPTRPDSVDADELERRREERRRMTNPEIVAINERRRRRRASLYEASLAFAQQRRFDCISPDGVAWVLRKALDRSTVGDVSDIPEALAPGYGGLLPVFYINPTADRELVVPVKPGRILVDVTHATSEDLAALPRRLNELRAGMGYRNAPGGRSRESTTWTREQFLEELPRATVEFEARHGRKPVDTELAIEMGISKTTFGRYKKRFLAPLSK